MTQGLQLLDSGNELISDTESNLDVRVTSVESRWIPKKAALLAVIGVVSLGLVLAGWNSQNSIQKPAAVDGIIGADSEEGFSSCVNFEWFVEGSWAAFRVEVPTKIEGKSYNFLMDTGSATIGICPDKKPADLSDWDPQLEGGDQWGACVAYGDGCHGFVGDVFTAKVQVATSEEVESNIVVMTKQIKEHGNACGKPESHSEGAEELDGIFGFSFIGANNVFCKPRPLGEKMLTFEEGGKCKDDPGELPMICSH
jgi:hypothetical protein